LTIRTIDLHDADRLAQHTPFDRDGSGEVSGGFNSGGSRDFGGGENSMPTGIKESADQNIVANSGWRPQVHGNAGDVNGVPTVSPQHRTEGGLSDPATRVKQRASAFLLELQRDGLLDVLPEDIRTPLRAFALSP
jgi:hypothetical protein